VKTHGYHFDPGFNLVKLGNYDIERRVSLSKAIQRLVVSKRRAYERAAAVHGPVGYGAEIDQQPEPVLSQEELQFHVLCFIFSFMKKGLAAAQWSALEIPSL